MQIDIAVLDDNQHFLVNFVEQIRQNCRAYPVDANVTGFLTAEEMLAFLREHGEVQIIFLDILLPDEDGVSLAVRLQREFPKIKIVFITAVLENVVDIFDARPSHFLVKPIDEQRLQKALAVLINELNEEMTQLVCFEGKGHVYSLRKQDIQYIESHQRQLQICLTDSTLTVYGSMDKAEQLVEGSLFRCHRSYLINPRHIKQMDKLEFQLYSGHRIPISRERRTSARETFFAYLAAGVIKLE